MGERWVRSRGTPSWPGSRTWDGRAIDDGPATAGMRLDDVSLSRPLGELNVATGAERQAAAAANGRLGAATQAATRNCMSWLRPRLVAVRARVRSRRFVMVAYTVDAPKRPR